MLTSETTRLIRKGIGAWQREQRLPETLSGRLDAAGILPFTRYFTTLYRGEFTGWKAMAGCTFPFTAAHDSIPDTGHSVHQIPAGVG